MKYNYGYYLKNVFINPVKAFTAILNESKLTRVAWISFAIGCLSYVIITLMGYHAIGWSEFPYKEYYPNYLSPYWWEVFVNPIWGGIIAFGFGIPCYYLAKIFKGKGSFLQTITVILLSSIVSLPIFIIVDIYILLNCPEIIEIYVKYGSEGFKPEIYNSETFRIIHNAYAYVAMTWQGIVTIVGLKIIHQNKWYTHIPGIVIGNIIFVIFLLLIQDYMAIIW